MHSCVGSCTTGSRLKIHTSLTRLTSVTGSEGATQSFSKLLELKHVVTLHMYSGCNVIDGGRKHGLVAVLRVYKINRYFKVGFA